MSEIRSVRNRDLYWFACGVAAGIAAAFFLDPVQGRQRRAWVTAKERRMFGGVADYGVKLGRRVKNKIFGKATEWTSRLNEDSVSDEVLRDRIRSAFGHVTHHAKDIQSSVEDGVVRLSGSCTEEELPALMKCVRRVKGVQRVINQLEIL
jgi:hypothetical protein